MGSPLTVTLAEVRVTDNEYEALFTYNDPPKNYNHFVDDGFGQFRDRQHAETFLIYLNSLSEDLEYTIEHPAEDGTIPYLDVLIHPDHTTSIYRKPTNTNLYTHHSSSTPQSTKNSVIRSLTRRAYNICSPKHLSKELTFLKQTFLANGYPLHIIEQVMDRTHESLLQPKKNTTATTAPALHLTLPYHHQLSRPLRKTLQRYDIDTTFSSPPTLKTLLTSTKTPTPTPKTRNCIYKIPCNNCDDFYIGQTYRPLQLRIKEHEAAYRLNNYTDTTTGNIKSAPAKHGREEAHTINWNGTSILKSSDTRSQLNLLEHAAIITLDPNLNRQHRGPKVNPCWTPLLPKISSSFHSRPSAISSFS